MPKPLTVDKLLDALYCTSPTGIGQLVRFLKDTMDVEVAGSELNSALGRLMQEGRVLTGTVSLGAGNAVTLYARPGYGIAGG